MVSIPINPEPYFNKTGIIGKYWEDLNLLSENFNSILAWMIVLNFYSFYFVLLIFTACIMMRGILMVCSFWVTLSSWFGICMKNIRIDFEFLLLIHPSNSSVRAIKLYHLWYPLFWASYLDLFKSVWLGGKDLLQLFLVHLSTVTCFCVCTHFIND